MKRKLTLIFASVTLAITNTALPALANATLTNATSVSNKQATRTHATSNWQSVSTIVSSQNNQLVRTPTVQEGANVTQATSNILMAQAFSNVLGPKQRTSLVASRNYKEWKSCFRSVSRNNRYAAILFCIPITT